MIAIRLKLRFPDETADAIADLNDLLTGYKFNPGDTYAEWRPGEKVAEYGLTGLITGGKGWATASAKTGLAEWFLTKFSRLTLLFYYHTRSEAADEQRNVYSRPGNR